jgi:hypothetical protein
MHTSGAMTKKLPRSRMLYRMVGKWSLLSTEAFLSTASFSLPRCMPLFQPARCRCSVRLQMPLSVFLIADHSRLNTSRLDIRWI